MARTFPGIGGGGGGSSDSSESPDTDDSDTTDYEEANQGGTGSFGDRPDDSTDETDSDPTDQPARGRDTQTGGQTDSPTYDTEPDSDTDTSDDTDDTSPSDSLSNPTGATGDRPSGGDDVSSSPDSGSDRTTRTFPGVGDEEGASEDRDTPDGTDDTTPADPGANPTGATGPRDGTDGTETPTQTEPPEPEPVITEPERLEGELDVDAATEAEFRREVREETAERYTQATTSELTFGREDISLQETEQGVRPVLGESAQREIEQAREERAAESIERQLSRSPLQTQLNPTGQIDVTGEDVSLTDSGVSIAEDLQREITARRASSQVGSVVQPGDVTAEGELTQETRDEIIAQRIDRQIPGQDITQEDITETGPTQLNPTRPESFTLTPETKTEIRTDQALSELQGQTETTLTERDIQVQPGQQVALTEQALNEEAAEQFTQEEFTVGDATVDTTAFERGEDFTVEDGEPQLTAEGRKMLIRSRVAQEGIETQQDEFSLLGVTLREEGTETRDIEDLSRLEFDEEGNLTGVSEQEDATFGEIEEEILTGAETLPGPAEGAVEFASPALAGARRGVDITGDISGDVAEGFSEEVAQPGSEVVGDVYRGAGETGMAIRGLYADVDQDLESDVETVASGAENLSRGVLETGSLALGIGETVETGTRVAGESGAFAVEEGVGESVEATADVTSDVAIQTAEQTVENPLRTAGTLAGTAALMSGAAKIGSRTGTATRYAIQPGEEIVGTVGSRATAAVSPRASRALFPQGEPILLSEEAAIAGARATGRGISSAGQRIRRAIEEPSTQFDATPRQRALVSEFRPRGATEVQQTVEDVGPGAPIGRGGELGAETESALDALEGVNVEQPASRPGEVEIEQTSDVSNMRASEQPSPGRRFLEGERGQASLVPRGRTETESETDVQEPFSGFEPSRSEILEGGTRDILRQEMQGRQLTQRRQLGGEFEGDFNPVGEAEARREQAQRREVRVGEEVETRAEPIRTELPQDDVTAGADQRLQVAQTPQVRTGVDLATEIGEDVGVEPLQSPLTDVEPRTDSVARTDLEQGVRFEREQEAETETDTELERELEAEAELEAELESELETELELEAETLPQKDDQRRRSDPRQTGIYADLFENPVVAPGELDEVLDAGE